MLLGRGELYQLLQPLHRCRPGIRVGSEPELDSQLFILGAAHGVEGQQFHPGDVVIGSDEVTQPGDILLHGHTHIPAGESFGDGNLYLNPGSVSIPKAESEHSYMILQDGDAVWKTLEGETFHSIKL